MGITLISSQPPRHRGRHRRPRRCDRFTAACFATAGVLAIIASGLGAMALAIVMAPAGGQL